MLPDSIQKDIDDTIEDLKQLDYKSLVLIKSNVEILKTRSQMDNIPETNEMK